MSTRERHLNRQGKESLGRIICDRGTIVGMILGIGGMLLAAAEAFVRTGTGFGVIIASSGAVFFGAGAGAKAWQSQAESRFDVAQFQVRKPEGPPGDSIGG
jgi:hypothetical protein